MLNMYDFSGFHRVIWCFWRSNPSGTKRQYVLPIVRYVFLEGFRAAKEWGKREPKTQTFYWKQQMCWIVLDDYNVWIYKYRLRLVGKLVYHAYGLFVMVQTKTACFTTFHSELAAGHGSISAWCESSACGMQCAARQARIRVNRWGLTQHTRSFHSAYDAEVCICVVCAQEH